MHGSSGHRDPAYGRDMISRGPMASEFAAQSEDCVLASATPETDGGWPEFGPNFPWTSMCNRARGVRPKRVRGLTQEHLEQVGPRRQQCQGYIPTGATGEWVGPVAPGRADENMTVAKGLPTWDPQGSSVRRIHTEFLSQLPMEIVYRDSLTGSGEAAKGVRNLLDPPSCGTPLPTADCRLVVPPHSAPQAKKYRVSTEAGKGERTGDDTSRKGCACAKGEEGVSGRQVRFDLSKNEYRRYITYQGDEPLFVTGESAPGNAQDTNNSALRDAGAEMPASALDVFQTGTAMVHFTDVGMGTARAVRRTRFGAAWRIPAAFGVW
jgi:hypothetical protein